MKSIFEQVLQKEEALQRFQSQFQPTWADFLEKGKKAQIGEIHEWRGKKFRKTQLGWVPVVQSPRTARKDKEGNPVKWDGKLEGPKEFGSPQFEKDLNTDFTLDTLYKNSEGWLPERVEKVHKPIVNSFVEKGTLNSEGQKTVTLMMGAPATGKGHLRKFLVSQKEIPENLVAVDPDDIKTKALAPDYDRYSEVNARKAASFVHEEGSDIAKEVFTAMESKGFDYLQDKVFSDYNKLVKEINRLDKQGYKVKIVMASCNVDEAYKRMLDRGKKTGRYVATDYFYQTHAEIEQTWDKLAQNLPSNVISAKKYNTENTTSGPQMVQDLLER